MVKYRFDNIAFNITRKRKPNSDDKYKYIGLEHLETGSLFVTKYGLDVDIKGEKLIMKKGDILLGKRNAYLRRAAIAPHDGLFSAHGMVLRPNKNIIDENFFPFFISSDYFFDEVIRISVGGLSPTVNWKDLAKIEFDIPSLDVQQKLAKKLWAAYRLKEAYKRLLIKTDEILKSQFIEMFPFVENPYGWRILRFNDFAKIDAIMTSDFVKYASYPHIGIDSIRQNTGELVGYRTVAEDSVKSSKYLFGNNHIIYSKIRPNLNKVATPSFVGLCSADSYPILANEVVTSKDFLAYLLRSDVFLKYIVPLSNRTGMPKVNREQVEGFRLPFPPKSLQEQFVVIIKQADKSKHLKQECMKFLDIFIESTQNE